MAQREAITRRYAEAAAARIRRDLGHISSETDWERRERNRREIEAERAANPWPWLEDLIAWNTLNSTPECRAYRKRWDPPPIRAHGNQ